MKRMLIALLIFSSISLWGSDSTALLELKQKLQKLAMMNWYLRQIEVLHDQYYTSENPEIAPLIEGIHTTIPGTNIHIYDARSIDLIRSYYPQEIKKEKAQK